MLIGHLEIESTTQKMALESSLESIEVVENLISKLVLEFSLTEDCCTNIWIALNEAVSNAIKHGNKFDPSKKVKLSVEVKYDRFLCFIIKDEGKGFDFTSIPDPTSPDRIGEPNGRGVFLINKLANIVNYTNKGSTLEMCFDMYKN